MTKISLLALAALLAVTATTAEAAVITSRKPTGGLSSHDDCRAEMGTFRIVRPAQLAGIGPEDFVHIQPVCENGDGGALRGDGNAAGLIRTIEQNDTLTGALEERRYAPEDVVGVRLGKDNTVILYVHRY